MHADDSGAASEAASRYEVGELLGEGGMARVHRAFDKVLKRTVALKLLRSDDPLLIQRFLREARAQAKVAHEHICPIYEVGVLGGRPFIAMQLVEGETLGAAQAKMTLEQRVRVLREVAEAVDAAHQAGLIHRDLKPANILVERTESGEWKPYVLDFGIAREASAEGLTMTGQLLGTPHYMSPEQALGRAAEVDRRTDVYALGATLYELCAGGAALLGCLGDRGPPPGHREGAGAAAPPQSADPSRSRDHRHAVPAQGSPGALRLGP
jgi:serine/threonine-protein kinase